MLNEVATIPQTSNLATNESRAIQALAEWLGTEDGQAAGDVDIQVWMVERGWPPRLWRKWAERIAADMALRSPGEADPRVILSRVNQRFERLAFKAEENNDLKHAIAATEAQAKLNNLGGFRPAAANATQVNVNVTNATAHLASDETLERIATATASVVESDPLLG